MPALLIVTVALHIVLIYALIHGLAYGMVKHQHAWTEMGKSGMKAPELRVRIPPRIVRNYTLRLQEIRKSFD